MDGLYGTVRPAVIDTQRDIEMFYIYKGDRSSVSDEKNSFIELEVDNIVSSKLSVDGKNKTINGLYDIKLPIDKFNKKGIYNIYIRPKEMPITITNIGTLASYPEIRGIVFNTNDIEGGITDLTGYRIDFLNGDGNKTGESRLITSSGFCSPSSTSSSSSTYRYTDTASNLIFCTVTPSLAYSFRPNYLPSIGAAEEEVIISNTKFNPEMIEIEMVENDADTLSYMLEGSQIRDLDRGKIVTFNDKNEIYKVHDYFTLKDKLGEPLYDVKVKKTDYDENGEDYKNIITES